MDEEQQAAYLRRLGLEVEPPSLDALQRLHRAHVERVPYETMWIAAGERWGIDVAGSVTRVALQGRGGYCFHLNGAFSELLASLGYAVTRHVGGVHGPDGPDAGALANHLVLTVSGLPSDAHPAGTWYVDAGLGDTLHDALPLAAGTYEQTPFQLALDETADGVGDWHLTHDPKGGFPGMSWRSAPTGMDAFVEKHQWLSTSPDSGFVRVATAQRRDATGVDVLRGLVLQRIGDGSEPGEPLTERDEWFAALADLFDLRFDGLAPELRDRLWERSLSTHRAWDAAGRP
ncbi:MAG: N-hydroxyarylamine O-acetyltransferase [Acidimicrobiaceae bacterium]